jgi:hypothetical protein
MASLSEVRRRALHSLIPPPPALTSRHDFPPGRHSSCVTSSDALEPRIKRLRELVAAGESSVRQAAPTTFFGDQP